MPDGSICARCGREADGRNYTVYFGWKTDEASRSTHWGTATVTRTATTYAVGGSDALCLCNRCVRRLNLPMNLFLFLATLVPGLWLVSTHLPWVIGGWLLLLVALGALISAVSTKVSVDDGEQAACKWARKQKMHGADTVFWTSKEFAKLKVRP